ncbi:MAG: hypothetical protein BWZ02_03274 [Lentisphaerae bacterium ADurb.BinA184]|nr:MAG: hypothetical protein BWZ02_03274 [Lentisphaerae bacterium ADurb.BinA184]
MTTSGFPGSQLALLPPAPRISVPSLAVICPVKVFIPLRVSVPGPVLVSPPLVLAPSVTAPTVAGVVAPPPYSVAVSVSPAA